MHFKFPKEKSDDVIKATDKILYYVARRDHSVKELRTKLSRRFTPEVIDKALEVAHERNWIKPPDELAQIVCERLHERGKGFRYISNYLMEKGLPQVDMDSDREREKAARLLANKYGDYGELSFDERQKAFRFLSQRGYDLETIKSFF